MSTKSHINSNTLNNVNLTAISPRFAIRSLSILLITGIFDREHLEFHDPPLFNNPSILIILLEKTY